MGFKDLETFNLALLAKQCWRLWNNPTALSVRVLKHRYFPHTDFLHATRGTRPSWAWTSILEGRKWFSEGALWQIGGGKSVRIWQDKWIPHPPYQLVNTHLHRINPNNG